MPIFRLLFQILPPSVVLLPFLGQVLVEVVDGADRPIAELVPGHEHVAEKKGGFQKA